MTMMTCMTLTESTILREHVIQRSKKKLLVNNVKSRQVQAGSNSNSTENVEKSSLHFLCCCCASDLISVIPGVSNKFTIRVCKIIIQVFIISCAVAYLVNTIASTSNRRHYLFLPCQLFSSPLILFAYPPTPYYDCRGGPRGLAGFPFVQESRQSFYLTAGSSPTLTTPLCHLIVNGTARKGRCSSRLLLLESASCGSMIRRKLILVILLDFGRCHLEGQFDSKIDIIKAS